MPFTTQIFTFAFFPICILGYYLVALLQGKGLLSRFLSRIRATDIALIGIGCVFYMWTCFDNIIKFLAYIFVIYILGFLIGRFKRNSLDKASKPYSVLKPILIASIVFTVLVLVYFKYTGMLADIFNSVFSTSIKPKSVVAPLGISFITFSTISYLVDIYIGKAKVGNFLDCTLYLTFFPKVVSGPIVLWRDFDGQINDRQITLDGISNGVSRIMIGFIKKLILADTFGACIDSARIVDTPTAWGIALLYMLQIYYDFSGYSDIAIGLSNMLGFSVKENFNFPYISTSITEFWRRWHISLGTWFREYIYFPLGGSRVKKARTIFNIAVVFVLTGIWHGAGWTYMLWGGINGICNIAEKLLSNVKLYQKTPKIVKWAFTMAVVFFCWELFRFEDFDLCKEWIKTMLGMSDASVIPYGWQYYFDTRIITFAVFGILGSTLFGLPKVQSNYNKFLTTKTGYAIHELVILLLFIVAVLFMVNSSYSPFIYFQY